MVSPSAFCQGYVTGCIRDSLGDAVSDAYVIAVDPVSARLLDQDHTDAEGVFRLTPGKTGSLRLRVIALGYTSRDTLLQEVTPFRESALENQDRICLRLLPDPTQLEEVVVQADRALRVGRDTVDFKVSAFVRGSEQVVEEVLDRLPGIEVSDAGEIRVRGKPVRKVLIEGDDLTDRNYRILTRNLDATAIETVQVLKSYQENPLLRGLRPSGAVAINLKLKESLKGKLSGMVSSGTGPSSRYDIRNNTMYLRRNSKLYALGGANTVGNDPAGEVFNLLHPSILEEDPLPWELERNEGIFTPGWPPLEIGHKEYVENRSALGSLHGVIRPVSGFKISSRWIGTKDYRQLLRRSLEQFRFEDLDFRNEESSEHALEQTFGQGFVECIANISDSQRVVLRQQWSRSRFQDQEVLVFNDVPINQQRDLSIQRDITSLHYTWRLGKATAFGVDIGRLKAFRNSGFAFEGHSLDNPLFMRRTEGVTEQELFSNVSLKGLRFTVDHKSGPWMLGGGVMWNSIKRGAVAHLFWLKGSPTDEGIPYEVGNRRETAGTWIRLQWTGPKLQFTHGMRVRFLRNILFQGMQDEVRRLMMEPRIGWKWQMREGQVLRATYAYEVRDYPFHQQWTALLFSGYRSLRSGWRRYFQNRIHRLMLGYTLGNWGERTMLHATCLMNQEPRYLGSGSEQGREYTLVVREPQRNRQMVSMNAHLDHYLPALASNIKLRVTLGSQAYENRVNGWRGRIRSRHFSVGPELRSALGRSFEFHLGIRFTRSWIQSRERFKRDILRGFLDLEYRQDTRWSAIFKGEALSFSEVVPQPFLLAELALSHRPQRSRFQFRCTAENVLNVGRFGYKNIQETGFYQSTIALQPRRILIQLTYRL